MRIRIVRSYRKNGDPRVRAGAIVEFAVVLPLLITILFGIIEYGWIFMIRQTLQHAAREGCRTAVLQQSTEADVTTRVTEVMEPTNVSGYTLIQTHGGDPTWVETVTVSVPYSQVTLLGGYFGNGDYDLIGSCSMRKEGMGGGP